MEPSLQQGDRVSCRKHGKIKSILALTLAVASMLQLSGCQMIKPVGIGELDAKVKESWYNEYPSYPDYDPLEYVTLGDYEDLTIKTPVLLKVTSTDVDDAWEAYRMDITEPAKDTKSTIKSSDMVNIDYDGDDGKGSDLKGKDLCIRAGEYMDEILVGKKPGDTVKYDDKKGIIWSVKINYIAIYPEITDENIEEFSNGEYKSVADVKSDIKNYYTQQNAATFTSAVNQATIEALLDCSKVSEVPASLKTWYVKNRMCGYWHLYNSEDNKETFDEWLLDNYGWDSVETMKSAMEDEAEEATKSELVLHAVGKDANIKYTDKMYASDIKKYAKDNGYESVKECEEMNGEAYLRDLFYLNTVLSYLIESADTASSE